MNIVKEFEELLESLYPNTKAIAVNSGTSALIACLQSLDLYPGSCDEAGDEVITTPFTFQATSDAILLSGGIPVFADINEHDHLINMFEVDKLINCYTKAIVPVNLFGRISMRSPTTRCNNIPIIEDSAQSFLHPHNMNTLSDAQCFSFYRTKNLQAGEGGAIVVKNDGLLDYEKIWSICNNGRLPGKPKYEHYNIGYNFRMSEHTALILYNQLRYHQKGITSEIGIYDESNGYYPMLVYQQPSYKKLGITGKCPVAEEYIKEKRNGSK